MEKQDFENVIFGRIAFKKQNKTQRKSLKRAVCGFHVERLILFIYLCESSLMVKKKVHFQGHQLVCNLQFMVLAAVSPH